jgi:hypothetical protein
MLTGAIAEACLLIADADGPVLIHADIGRVRPDFLSACAPMPGFGTSAQLLSSRAGGVSQVPKLRLGAS